MRKELELYNHQKEILKKNPKRILLCWDTGIGKSLAFMLWVEQNKFDSLMIVPKPLKAKWQRDVAEYPRRIMILTKEEFKEKCKELPPFQAIGVDEAHHFAGMTSGFTKCLQWYLKKHEVKNIWLLTATPYLSTPWNIYTLAKLLGYKWSYYEFKNRFFTEKYIGRRAVPVIKSGIEDEIAELVKQIGDTVKAEECADIPEQRFVLEYMALNKDQIKAMKVIETSEINPVVKFTKYHQIENGTLKTDGYIADQIFTSDKVDRIKDLCEQNDKVAIFCRYNLQVSLLKEKLADVGKEIFIITGAVENRDEAVQQAEASKKCIVIINASCSEGYELPSIGFIIFASLSFSYKDYKQGLGRFLRLNKLKKNVYVHLVVKEGVDEAVYQSIMKKQDFDIAIYSKEVVQ